MGATAVNISCSFCRKTADDVATLVAGPGVYICNECVDLCSQVMADKQKSEKPLRATGVRQVAVWDAEVDLPAVLSSLPRVAQARSQADHALTQYVRRARTLGATWTVIGQALGITRQSAWERFSGEE